MKHFALAIGILFLLVFAFNSDCRSEDSAVSAAEQSVAEVKVDAKAPCEGKKQEAKGAADEAKEKAEKVAEGAKGEAN